MASVRNIYVQADVEENLKSIENISKLVNDLLREHFKGNSSYKKQELEKKILQLRLFIDEKQEELFSMQKDFKKLEEEEKAFNLLFKEVPEEVLADFHFYPNMTEEILEQRINNIYSRNYPDMNYNLIRQAFKAYFKKRDEENVNSNSESK